MKTLINLLLLPAFFLAITLTGINLALLETGWNQIPTDWHLRLFAWHAILTGNFLLAFAASFSIFFCMIRRME